MQPQQSLQVSVGREREGDGKEGETGGRGRGCVQVEGEVWGRGGGRCVQGVGVWEESL